MHFDTAALIAIIALFACFFVWLMWARYAPLRLALVDESASGSFAGAADTSGLGKVGELVTALMMAKDGWQKLPSPRGGIDGLDGVFVKKIGGKQFDVRIVETKCAREGDAKSSYEAAQLADDRVIEQLERLKGATLADGGYIDDQAIEAIVKAIRRGSMHVSKQLYAHTLDEGQSLIYSVRPDGALIDRRARVKRVSGAPHRLMLQALAAGLSRVDGGSQMAASSTPAE
jgi:hypothetical protein